jgi:sec-independent protein translocase protein TatC
MTDDQATMSVIEHLEELRRRIIITGLAVAGAAVAGFFLAEPALALLREPLPEEYRTLFVTHVTDAFAVRLRIAIFLGIALAMPIILFQIWRFVTPGLTTFERRVAWPLLVVAIALFALGATLGYFIIPFALNFLLGFLDEGTEPILTLPEYVGFVTTMMLVFGLVLEYPIVLLGLVRAGILRRAFLARQRRAAILIMAVIAVIVTPADPFSTIILLIPMYGLYEVTLFLARVIERRR